jgi:dimeric dUTPase (all-alpha-NTP-PPase superfamily)
MLEHYLGCTRFVYNKTLDYSIKHYASRETKFNSEINNKGNAVFISIIN